MGNKGKKKVKKISEKPTNKRKIEEIEEAEIVETPAKKMKVDEEPLLVQPETVNIDVSPTAKLIVILERASLETVKYGSDFHLLNCDDHQTIMKKNNRNPAESRPDISHQCLLNLLDSPLNKAGKLQIFIHTEKNVLIEVNPKIRIPRTYKRFSGLMVQLLHKLSIRATNGSEKLLKVIKNPVEAYLPVGVKKIALSYSAEELVDIGDYVGSNFQADGPAVIAIGAMSHGKIEPEYVEKEIGISEYPLSAAVCCVKVCTAFEKLFGIL